MSQDDIPRVSVEEAQLLLDEQGYRYLDVRAQAEYAAGHPVGAYNVPLLIAEAGRLQPNPHFLGVMRAVFPADTKLLVGCKSGVRSLRAARELSAAGYTEVVDLRPGFAGTRNPFGHVTEKGWSACGKPSELTTEGRSYEELVVLAGPSTSSG